MTDETINKLCAEALGGCYHELKPESVEVGLRLAPCIHCGDHFHTFDEYPLNEDYCTDRNAVARLVEAVGKKDDFETAIELLVRYAPRLSAWEVLKLPPKTIALAWLVTMGKITLEEAKDANK